MKRHQVDSDRKFQKDFKLYNTLTTWKNNGVYLPKLSKIVPIQYLVREGDPTVRPYGAIEIRVLLLLSNKERWISANSWKLIDERKIAKATRDQARTRLGWRHTDEVYRCLDKEVKKSCRTDKKRWFEDKASEAQAAADNNDPKILYRIVRELTGARSNAWFV